MRRLLLILVPLLFGFVAMSQAAVEQPARTALVIGNAKYPSSPLANPVNDAQDMRDKLTKLGFDVIFRQDAGLRDMDAAVREFGSKLKRGGAGVFYYAGHAIQISGQNYLVPVDAKLREEIDVRYETLDVSYVLDTLYAAENNLNIVILDACRDNPFQRSFRSTSRGLARMDAPTGTLIAYATSPGKTALDGDGRNGVYTKHLLECIDQPGVPMEQMFKQVRIGVANETSNQQIPWESSSVMGNFSFNPQATAARQDQIRQPVEQTAAESTLTDYELEKRKLEQVRTELQAAYEEEKRRLEEMNALLKEKAEIAELKAEKERLEKQRILAEKEATLAKEQEQGQKQIQTMEAEKAMLETPVSKAPTSKTVATAPTKTATSGGTPKSKQALDEEEARQKLAMLKQPAPVQQPTTTASKPAPQEAAPKTEVAALAKKERSLSAGVRITCNVMDAEVYVAKGSENLLGGFLSKTSWTYLGTTPLTKNGLDTGEQQFRIAKNGYEDKIVTMRLRSESVSDLNVRLNKKSSFMNDSNFDSF